VLLFIATLGRLAWRLATGQPRGLPTHAPWERAAARLVHFALYLLLLGVMISGYLISTADGRPVAVFGWFKIPALISGIERQEDIAGLIHLILASVLIALALVHAGGALKHHLFDHDRTLRRMLGR
jgi:cytochrome b561